MPPWGSSQFQDYARLRDEFGISPFGADEYGVFAAPHRLFRRGVVFGHRDFERVKDAVRGQDAWSVMTGFMPSGDLHLGHKMVLEQVVAHQGEGADVHLALADFEAMAARGFTREKAQRVALDQYVHNALALGLSPERAEFYFQTKRNRVNALAHRFAQRVTWATMQALYGFEAGTSVAHLLAPLVQAADILHTQADEGGARPVLVPVGVDQDPHIRLTRDIAADWRWFGLTWLKGGKGPQLTVSVRRSEDKKSALDLAEKALRDNGYGEFRRNDAYGTMEVKGGTPNDERRIDLALARAEQEAGNEEALLRPSATFHRFMTGLQGGKMSSSKPESSIYLTEDPKTAEKKLKSAMTGGRATAEEQRRLGANPYVCPVYETYLYHLAKDDAHLQEVHDTCKSGARLCGGCKGEAWGLLETFLRGHKERRDEVAHQVQAVVSPD
ncbi:MAG: tryptophan--tRNA ligase [Halobacteriales archaeon]|nr:tryptophan--tRNA ligase [Halobacteriales archaeon]